MDRATTLLMKKCGWVIDAVGEERIRKALADHQSQLGVEDSLAYEEKVLVDEDFQNALVDMLVVPETDFFRYPQSFQLLSKLAKEWLIKKDSDIFTVASIPCATGEEPYSIAMALAQVGIPLDKFRVDAMDVSLPLVESSREGIYEARHLKKLPVGYMLQYFESCGASYQVKSALRERVCFYQGNVNIMPSEFFTTKYNVVFCRNLMIYLTDNVRDNLYRQIKAIMRRNASLFVGSPETQYFQNKGMSRIDFSQAFALDFSAAKKRTTLGAMTKTKALLKKKSLYKAVHASREESSPLFSSGINKPSIELAEKKLKSLTSNALPKSLPHDTKDKIIGLPESNTSDTNEEEKKLDDVRRLADEGDLKEAGKRCKFLLTKYKTVAVFTLYGEVLLAQGNRLEAFNCIKKVLYLEPNNEEALAHAVNMASVLGQNTEQYKKRLEKIRR